MDAVEYEQLLANYKRALKQLKQSDSSNQLKEKLESFLESALRDVKIGLSHPSKNFIELILIPGDPSTDETIIELILKAKDKTGIIVKKNKELLKIMESPYCQIKTSYPRLEQQPYVKAYLLFLINNFWAQVFRLSDLDQHQAQYNISFLMRMKSKIKVADELISELIRLNEFAGSRKKGLKPPTTFAFVEGIKFSVSELSSLSFTRHLDVSALTLRLLLPDLVRGVSRSAISQKRWRKSKSVKISD